MATDQGLAVPVIKNVESLTVLEVARELNRLIKRGKSGTFSPSDLSGATFSISNIGIVSCIIPNDISFCNYMNLFFRWVVLIRSL